MTVDAIRPLQLQATQNDKMCTDWVMKTTQCPLYKRSGSQELCSHRYCYDASSSIHGPLTRSMRCTRSKKSIHSDKNNTMGNELVQDSKDTVNNECASLLTISSTGVLHRKHNLGFLNQQEEKPATLNTAEKSDVKRRETSLVSCLLCNKLQRPQIAQCNINSIFFSAITKLFPLLRPSARILGHKQIKLRRQELKSKAIMGLLFTLTRLLCVLQMAKIPVSDAVNSMISQNPTRYDGQPQKIAFFLNTTATVIQTSQPDFQIKPLSPNSHELDIIPSSPAPVASTFLMQGQAQMLSPINKSHDISIVNRETILKHINEKINTTVSQYSSVKEPTLRGNGLPSASNSVCSTCQFYKAKNDSLESIKMHILSKLRLSESPNLEIPRQLPQNIIDDYYRKYDRNGRRRTFKSTFQTGKRSATSFDSHPGSWKSHDSYEDDMQNDDPNVLHSESPLEYYYDDTEYDDEEGDSLVKSIYVFPTLPRMRHNKKSDVLSFRYENSDSTTVMRTVLHLYVRGWDWLTAQEPEFIKQLNIKSTEDKTREIIVAVYRALRRPSASNYTHTVKMAEIRQSLPTGPGKWIQINLQDLTRLWLEKGESNQVIVIKTSEAWMRPFVVTGVGKSVESYENVLTAHIEVRTGRKAGRRRRSTSLDCQESDNEVRCCRYPLKVNFTSFGWSFVVAPTDFDAYFCNGECKLGYLEQYTHTHIASLSRSASPCCSPTKMSSLTLLHFNLDQNLVLSTIPNMTVDKCSCS